MKCQQCDGRAQLPLCKRCTTQLAEMLIDLGWLVGELEVTAGRRDRLTTGMARATEHPAPISFGAVDLMRDVTTQLRHLHGVVLLPEPRQVVKWLHRHFDELVRAPDAHKIYRAIERLVGFNSNGPIHDAINRPDVRFAGQCPDCGEYCYSRHADIYAVCDECGLPVDVEKNRLRTIAAYDLLTERVLFAVLDNLDEHVSRVRLYEWIKSGRLPVAGYLTSSGIVMSKGGHKDPRVFSLRRVRALRQQTSQLALAR